MGAVNSSEKNISFSMIHKVFIIVVIVAGTLGYSVYKKAEIEKIIDESDNPILRRLPVFSTKLLNGDDLALKDIMKKDDPGLFVHFWATWCAPCEAELPDFIDFARKNKELGVKFLLLAVKDDDMKIKKFTSRFMKDLPENVIFAHDKEGASMPLFGTVKVPETYLFNRTQLNVKKYTGPQDWSLDGYFAQVKHLLLLNQ